MVIDGSNGGAAYLLWPTPKLKPSLSFEPDLAVPTPLIPSLLADVPLVLLSPVGSPLLAEVFLPTPLTPSLFADVPRAPLSNGYLDVPVLLVEAPVPSLYVLFSPAAVRGSAPIEALVDPILLETPPRPLIDFLPLDNREVFASSAALAAPA